MHYIVHYIFTCHASCLTHLYRHRLGRGGDPHDALCPHGGGRGPWSQNGRGAPSNLRVVQILFCFSPPMIDV